jgi:hypothetical protein
MSIHQTIYDTLDKTADEVMAIICAGDIAGVEVRQEKMRTFLKGHTWSLESYKSWVKDGSWTPDKPARGLGDVVAKATSLLGMKSCGGCGKRQRKWNEVTRRKNG